jgi:hypothetical protein
MMSGTTFTDKMAYGFIGLNKCRAISLYTFLKVHDIDYNKEA